MWYVNLYNFCPSWMIAEAVPTKIQLMISQDHQEEKAFGGQFLPLSRTIRAPFYRNNSKRKWGVHCVKSWTKRIVHCYTQHSKTNIDWPSVIVCLRMWTKLCDVQVPRCVRLDTYKMLCWIIHKTMCHYMYRFLSSTSTRDAEPFRVELILVVGWPL